MSASPIDPVYRRPVFCPRSAWPRRETSLRVSARRRTPPRPVPICRCRRCKSSNSFRRPRRAASIQQRGIGKTGIDRLREPLRSFGGVVLLVMRARDHHHGLERLKAEIERLLKCVARFLVGIEAMQAGAEPEPRTAVGRVFVTAQQMAFHVAGAISAVDPGRAVAWVGPR